VPQLPRSTVGSAKKPEFAPNSQPRPITRETPGFYRNTASFAQACDHLATSTTINKSCRHRPLLPVQLAASDWMLALFPPACLFMQLVSPLRQLLLLSLFALFSASAFTQALAAQTESPAPSGSSGLPSDQAGPSEPGPTGTEARRRNKRILLLYTHRLVSPVNSEWYQGIMSELNAAFNEPLDIEVEYLDLLRNNDEEFERKWLELLRSKYDRKRPDVVIPIYIGAIEFILKHREEIFPDVPVVFCSAPQNLADQARKLKGVTGTVFEIDFNGTRELIKRLLPAAKNLVVVTGSSRTSLDMRSAMGVGFLFSVYFAQAFEVDVWDGVPLREMETRIARLPPDTAVLLLSFDFDKQGNQYVTVEVAEQLAKCSSAPIFGVFDSLLGRGVIGGSMATVQEQGRMAGRLTVDILRGTAPDELPIQPADKPRLLLDARQLKRFGISSKLVPATAEVFFQTQSSWQVFGWYLVGGMAALLVQTGIIVSLLVNRRRRIAAEREAGALAGKILTAQEEERSHLARELHDDLSQKLAAVAIEAGKLENQTAPQSVEKGSLGQLKQGIISICDDLHRLSRQMHPSILDDFGLADALCADCTGLMQRTDIEVDCQIGELPARIPKPVELCLYRIAQESLWNAVKHSGATRITVKLAGDLVNVCLEIADNGRGLGTADRPLGRGLGLASIKERARLVSGAVEFVSEPGKGTRVVTLVPLRSFQS